MKEKLIAGFMAALMALMTAVYPVLGATALKDFPTFLGVDGTANYYIVVGSTAASSDVAGAIDIATRLAELSYTSITTGGAAVTGLDRDGITLCTGAVSTCGLSTNNGLGNAFPSTTLKNAQFSGLKTGTVLWNNVDYKYHEQVDVGGVRMRHSLTTDKINGTEKMVVGTSADIKYQYVFDQTINMSSYNSKGTISNPEYSKPVKIKMLGKDFTVVGVGTTSIKMLSGSSGVVTATQGLAYGDYIFYGAAGVSGTTTGASLQVKVTDKAGNPVETVLVLLPNTADTTKTTTTLTIKVLSVSALTDGTVLGAEIVVGPSGTTEVEYDSAADTSTTTKDKFPGTTDWYITYTASSGIAGHLTSGSSINVEYRPSEVQYLLADSKVSLPNNYGELGYSGFNTNTFAIVTVKPVSGAVAVVNSTDQTAAYHTLYGLEITADQPNSIGSGNMASPNWWNSMYLLFNATVTDGTTTGYPVMVGYKGTTGRVYVNDTISKTAASSLISTSSGATELAYAYLNLTALQRFDYAFKLNYGGVGEATFYLNVSVRNITAGAEPKLQWTYAGGTATSTSISAGFYNKTAWTSDPAIGPMQFQLGPTGASSDDYEINMTTEGTGSQNAAKKVQEMVDDSGLIVQSTSSSTGSDSLVFKIPNKVLGVHAYFGKPGAGTTAGETKHVIEPITSAVAVLDSEVTATHKAKNLVLVGGPCVNTLVASLATAGKFPYGCTDWPARNFGRIQIIDEPFNVTGVKAVVVAGTRAADTRTACTVLQQYGTWLSTQTSSAVEVTSLTAAGITAV